MRFMYLKCVDLDNFSLILASGLIYKNVAILNFNLKLWRVCIVNVVIFRCVVYFLTDVRDFLI